MSGMDCMHEIVLICSGSDCDGILANRKLEAILVCELLIIILDEVHSVNLHAQKTSKPLNWLVKYMLDIAMGMDFLSERGLIHRVSIIHMRTMLLKGMHGRHK